MKVRLLVELEVEEYDAKDQPVSGIQVGDTRWHEIREVVRQSANAALKYAENHGFQHTLDDALIIDVDDVRLLEN